VHGDHRLDALDRGHRSANEYSNPSRARGCERIRTPRVFALSPSVGVARRRAVPVPLLF
jgi:hypothetical protein